MRFALVCLFLCFLSPSRLSAQAEKNLDSLLWDASRAVEHAEYETAFDLFLKSLDLAEKEGRKDRLPVIYYHLGLIQHHNQVYDRALFYMKKSVETARINRDSQKIALGLNFQGIIYFYLEHPDSSIACFESSAAVYTAIGDKSHASFAYSKIGNVLESKGEYDKATPYFQRQLKDAREASDSLVLLSAHINMATNALNLKHFTQGIDHIRKAKTLATQLERGFEYKECLKYEADLLEMNGQPQEALTILREYLAEQDSFLNAERSRQIAEMEARFEAKKREALIQQQEKNLYWSRIAMITLTGLLVLTFVAGFLFYRLTRQLRKRNAEKELLIREIHHRVKNNLQVLSSLLHLQSRQIQDGAALEAVREGQNRVEAMGLIHQKLYLDENLASVDMANYLQELGAALLDAYGMQDSGRVQIHYRTTPIRLDVDTAIPVGLIANELISNALKHAFPGKTTGAVEVILGQNQDGSLLLEVGDNGIGVTSKDIINNPSSSFGTRLINLLSQNLKGIPEIIPQAQGHRTRICFEKVKTAGP